MNLIVRDEAILLVEEGCVVSIVDYNMAGACFASVHFTVFM